MSGWISLHRTILEWEWYDDVNTSRLFIHCLLKANHAPGKWKGINVDRGQFITSLSKLSTETNLSVKQVRNALKKLNSTNEVASESNSQHTVITIKNYEKYQDEGKQKGKARASEGQSKGKRGATNNKNNNEDNENKNIIPPKIEWVHSYMSEQGFKDLSEAERFFDYWESIGWARKAGKMKDWKASVRTWLKNKTPTTEQISEQPEWMRGLLR